MTKRRFALALDLADEPALIAEYERHHANVWPAIEESICAAGIERLEIYRAGNRLFMVMEVSPEFSFDAKGAADSANPAVQEWERLMWQYQRALPWAKPGEKWILMDRIYELEARMIGEIGTESMTSEDTWQDKSDIEVYAGMTQLDDYTEEGQRLIRAEFDRRGLDRDRMETETAAARRSSTARSWGERLLQVVVVVLMSSVFVHARHAGDPTVHGVSAEISARACDNGNAEGCADLGDVLLNGSDLPMNWPAAAEVYQQSCTLGSARGCNSLGLMNEYGSAIPKDQARARSLYKTGCDGGDAHACANLKRIGD